MTLAAEQRLEQARADVEQRQAQRVEAGLCGCPCGNVLPAVRSSRTRYLGERHRDAAHKERVKAEAEALGVPVRQSLKSLETTARTSERRGDAPAPRKRAQRRPRSGVSIYLPRPELVELVVEALDGERLVLEAEGTAARARDVVEALEAVRKARARLERRRAPA